MYKKKYNHTLCMRTFLGTRESGKPPPSHSHTHTRHRDSFIFFPLAPISLSLSLSLFGWRHKEACLLNPEGSFASQSLHLSYFAYSSTIACSTLPPCFPEKLISSLVLVIRLKKPLLEKPSSGKLQIFLNRPSI